MKKENQQPMFMDTLGAVDPHDPTNLLTPLWCVFGPRCSPSLISCILSPYGLVLDPTDVVIWGHSIREKVGGFRTLGVEVRAWTNKQVETYGQDAKPLFFKDITNAFMHLHHSLKPARKAVASTELKRISYLQGKHL
mgnify:CR=1 FL=1